MSFLLKVLACFVCLHGLVTCLPIKEQFEATQSYASVNGPKKFSHTPALDIDHYKRTVPDSKYVQSSQFPSTNTRGFEKTRYETSGQQKTQNQVKMLNPDCSEHISQDCDEQRKLIKDIFKYNIPKTNANTGITSRHSNVNEDNTLLRQHSTPASNTIDELDLTTPSDFELDDRTAPEIVAAFLG